MKIITAGLMAVALSGCAADQGTLLRQQLGLVPSFQMQVQASDDGKTCSGGVALTSEQRNQACNDALAEKRRQIQQANIERQRQASQSANDADEARKEESARHKTAVSAQANASPKLLAYERASMALARYRRVMFFVSTCNARSPYWQGSMNQYIALRITDIRKSTRLSEDEYEAAKMMDDRATRQVDSDYGFAVSMSAANFNSLCERLIGGQDIARLDALQTKVTGNYH